MRFVTLAFGLALSSTAWAADPFVGTWTFNKARSEVGSVNLGARVFVITAWGRTRPVSRIDNFAPSPVQIRAGASSFSVRIPARILTIGNPRAFAFTRR